MTSLDLEEILSARTPRLMARIPQPARKWAVKALERLLRLKEIRRIVEERGGLPDEELLDDGFDALDVSYSLSLRDRRRIPPDGRLIIVANHPLGALDGLALLRTVLEVRKDVRVIVNDLLTAFGLFPDHFLPYDVFGRKVQKSNLDAIRKALELDEAVLFFPSAEVARMTWKGIREGKWRTGPVKLARDYAAPVLPVYIRARNSRFFYGVSLFSRSLSMLLLPREIFTQRHRKIEIRIGDPIPAQAFAESALRPGDQAALLKKHVNRLARGRTPVFRTERSVVRPVPRSMLRRELEGSEYLGMTPDGKRLHLARFEECPSVMREIARLREVTFRSVGEGTGRSMDMDSYDRTYRHLILYDEAEMDLVGSYRLGLCREILARDGPAGLYSASLFRYSDSLKNILPEAVELGRSFIQRKYWNSRALDTLWQGIGAFLACRPEIRYLFGCVSISASYPPPARDLLVAFYRTWFGSSPVRAASRRPYAVSGEREAELRRLIPGRDYRKELLTLKQTLKHYGSAIPTLYKQYTELCEPGGVHILDFGIDADFGNCVDGLILVDVSRITEAKRKRYIRPPSADACPDEGSAAS